MQKDLIHMRWRMKDYENQGQALKKSSLTKDRKHSELLTRWRDIMLVCQRIHLSLINK
jgi:hypothetical protein